MNNWSQKFKQPIFFVTPDIKRGLGLEDVFPNFHIIVSFWDELIPVLRKKGSRIFCLEEISERYSPVNNSGQLLSQDAVLNYIKKASGSSVAQIAFFKPSVKLDEIIKMKGFRKIGNDSALNRQIENKVNLPEFLGNMSAYLLPGKIGRMTDFSFVEEAGRFNLPLVVQFGFGWAGKNTYFIDKEEEFKRLKKRFPNTLAKVTAQIKALTVLNNCCLYHGQVLISPPALQINGFSLLSQNKAATCGRQWPAVLPDKRMEKEIKDISIRVGDIMNKSGFRGFFGLDFLIEENTGKIYLTEINPRLTASSAFYTYLEKAADCLPLLSYHYAEFSSVDLPLRRENGKSEITGCQLSLRNRETFGKINMPQNFGIYGYQDNKWQIKRVDYNWKELKKSEIIYFPQNKKLLQSELARIETKMPAVSSSYQLAPWVKHLFSLNL
ncbi:hypothetical protein A3D78_02630 [Candidatus Gottesmanbacteria bacterium RIFCSPHIGHO2_02_FULL_39_14]|uniref:ATP-grasp domain-containing protein n=1 Tax=Candidatus Gottesmanbacteria bacterium RIFCSPHIGHO2_02_FULL_39_14 TaxID=1798383 RepID=A0A1F6A3I4_9BACT|nr:MAG: hypothetical protein A3D78_02630 [Candidatus Gottesmanbacteria bacterium RIFCSPHIGHO2_02_FULL_39_14]